MKNCSKFHDVSIYILITYHRMPTALSSEDLSVASAGSVSAAVFAAVSYRKGRRIAECPNMFNTRCKHVDRQEKITHQNYWKHVDHFEPM
jgi:hypothetical protein